MKKYLNETFHILIIDEPHSQSKLYAQNLTDAGYTVTRAATIEAAQALCQEACPNIVIIERSLPGLNITKLCQQIKAKHPATFIFLLTEDKTDETDMIEEFEAGADAYLIKPVSTAELLARVRVAARLFQTHHELQKREWEYRLLTENVTDLIGRVSITGEFQYISPNSQAFFGCAPEEVMGTIVADWIHPDDQSRVDDVIDIFHGEVNQTTVNHRIKHRDGHYIWVETNVRALKTGKDEVVFVARNIDKHKQAESRVQLLSKALMATDQSVVITNQEGMIEWVNPAFTLLTGYDSEEIIGNNTRILKSNRQSPEFYADLWQTILAGKMWHGELINRRKDGQEYVEEMTISPVVNGDEKISHFIAIKQDVTAAREGQENLRQSEYRYRTLIEHLPDIILRYDKELRFVYVSENVVQVSGIPAQDYIGKTHYEVDLSPEWAEYWQTNIKRVMASKNMCDGEYLHNGTNERQFHFYWRLVPEFDYEGNVTGVLGIFQNVTQQQTLQKKQQAIARIASSLRQAVTSVEMMPIILEELLSIMQASDVVFVAPDLETADWVVEQAVGEHAYMIGLRLPAANPITDEIFANEKPYINNDIINEPALPYREMLGSIRAVAGVPLSIHGIELGIIWIARAKPILSDDFDLFSAMSDIAASALYRANLFEETQQQALGLADRVHERTAALSLANTQLSAALHSRDLFLASMSHELRTPLSVILMRTEILQDQVQGSLNAKQNRALDVIYQSAQHQLALISDILDVAKIEAGQVSLDFETVVVQDVCQASLHMVQGLAQQKEINISFQIIPKELRMVADSRRLKQILVNLLTNAVKFTPEKGEVGLLVKTEPEDDAIRFSVWDTGIGVRKEDISKMFEPFVQIDNGLTKKYAGTGLGLSLVHHLVELHGGGIQIESEVNEGLHISCLLPHQTEQELVASPTDQQQKAVQKSKSTRKTDVKILVAEDNKTIVDGLIDYFSAYDYEIIVAQNGVEALEKIAEHVPNLVLMDIHMPDMDGLEAIKRIRKASSTQIADVPIVALTALAMPGDLERCLEVGATTYLPKPFSLVKLKTIIDDLLDLYKEIPDVSM